MPNEIFNPEPIPPSAYTNGTLWNWKLGNYDVPWLQVYSGGVWVTFPMHKDGCGGITTTLVNAGRNALAEVIGRQIGRTQTKIDGLVIPFLYAHEWSKILNIYKDNLSNPTKYFDAEAGEFITRLMYIGDRSEKRFAYRQAGGGEIEIYQDCSFNLIDMGVQNASS